MKTIEGRWLLEFKPMSGHCQYPPFYETSTVQILGQKFQAQYITQRNDISYSFNLYTVPANFSWVKLVRFLSLLPEDVTTTSEHLWR